MAEEEASAPSKAKPAPKAGAKKGAAAPKNVKPAGPGAIAAGGGITANDDKAKEEPETFAATGLDNALDLLDVVTAKMDKASVGQRAADIERHPEVRSIGFDLFLRFYFATIFQIVETHLSIGPLLSTFGNSTLYAIWLLSY